MIRLAEKKDIPELKALWQEVFQEEKAYLDAFFIKLFKEENALIYEEDDQIVAALHMIPYTMMTDGVEHRLLYLYAIGTMPGYRGRGYAGAITREALRIAEDRGYSGAFLVPAEESLFRWYEGMGFETVFQKTQMRMDAEELLLLEYGETEGTWTARQTSNREELWDLYRESPFYQDNWVQLTREQNDFFLDELFRSGGDAWILEQEDEKYYALLNREEESLTVYETTIHREELTFFLDLVKEDRGNRSLVLHQPIGFKPEESRMISVPFAMIFQFKEMPLYKPGINRVLM